LTSERIAVAVFRAANNWPLYAALGNGALDEAGIEVELSHVASSNQQMSGLIEGDYDVVHTAADNVLAFHMEPEFGDVAEKPAIFMGGDDGFLSLHTSRRVTSFAGLKGARVGFDSTKSGFAFVLKKILAMEGLGEGAYGEVVAGGTEVRYRALLEGSIDAALMTPPHDLLCTAAGLTRLVDAARYLPRYQGLVGASRPNSVPEPSLKAYRAALGKGLLWLKDAENKAEAVEILMGRLQAEGDASLFSDVYDSMLSCEAGGFDPGGRVNLRGLEAVAGLRRELSPTARMSPLQGALMLQ
jgi:ABC-type nitrate/sulfonate/bicarbonate transport system substrate-binding protein